jgi:choline dehydrogenase-like flavoprotein
MSPEVMPRTAKSYADRRGAFAPGGLSKLRSPTADEGVWDGHSVAFSGWDEDETGARLDQVYISLSSHVMKPAIRSAVLGETEVTAAIADDQAWRERSRTALSSYWHPTSTCAIGRVVDGDARVRGLDNVHVTEASIMPSVPRATTHLSVLAVAERAAELLGR